MDEQRFDDLARMVGSGLTRRRLLGVMAAGAAWIGVRGRSANAQCANPGTCVEDIDCCTGFECDSGSLTCVEVVPPCLENGASCSDGTECCSELCNGGLCVSCLPDGAPSNNSDDCCSFSVYDGVCVSCVAYGGEPCDVGECCDGMCVESEFGGSCAGCRAPGLACSGNDQCCSDLCLDGFCTMYRCGQNIWQECDLTRNCVDGFCVGGGDSCASDSACGEGAVCCDSRCQVAECCEGSIDQCGEGEVCQAGVCAGVACLGEGETCTSNDECCDGLACLDSACGPAAAPTASIAPTEPIPNPVPTATSDSGEAVTDLPNTGAGTGSGGTLPVAGIATGGAVVLAHLWRRSMHNEPQEAGTDE